MTFENLGLSQKVLDAVKASGYTEPTPIQEQAIPHVIERRDVLGIAQTGTGKTASFTLPMLSLLERGRARARMPRTLILEPTRELAAQVEENFLRYGQNHKLTVALLIGGVSFVDQFRKLDRGADVLIATPGRLLDHFERGKLLLTGVEILVIDEADRMLDMGFIPDIERIAKLIPFTRQTLFFSATMPPEISRLVNNFLQNPVEISVARRSSASETIVQHAITCGSEPKQKRAVLRKVIDDADSLTNAIIFCNRKRDVATVARSLERHKYSVGALHGDMDQHARTAMLKSFRDDKIKLLVASDVAARGLDIPDVSHIFNFDVPVHAEDYVHRIGRTGRAGRTGNAVMLVTGSDKKGYDAIEELLGTTIDWHGAPVEWDERAGRRGRKPSGKPAREDNSTKPDKARLAAKAQIPAKAPRVQQAAKPKPAQTANTTAPATEIAANSKPKPTPIPRTEAKSDRNAPRKHKCFREEEHVPEFLLRPVR